MFNSQFDNILFVGAKTNNSKVISYPLNKKNIDLAKQIASLDPLFQSDKRFILEKINSIFVDDYYLNIVCDINTGSQSKLTGLRCDKSIASRFYKE